MGGGASPRPLASGVVLRLRFAVACNGKPAPVPYLVAVDALGLGLALSGIARLFLGDFLPPDGRDLFRPVLPLAPVFAFLTDTLARSPAFAHRRFPLLKALF